jgi:hypothetical protein
MMRFLTCILFLVSFNTFYSQIVSFHFLDKRSGEVIPNVQTTIQLLNSGISKADSLHKLISDTKGSVRLKVPINSLLIVATNHPLYENFSQGYRVKETRNDTLIFDIVLKPSSLQNLKEIVIKAPGIPDTVYSSDRLSVADFEIQKNGKIVLLTYPKQIKKGGEIVLFDGFKEQSSFPLEDIPEKLIRDFRGNTHVLCENNVFTIVSKENEIQIATLEKDYFMKYVAPIVDTNRTKLYLNNFNSAYPAFDYFTFDKIDSTYKRLMHIEDDFMMELYKSEYKWMDVRTKLWAKNKEIETGIEAEIWVGANYFTQSLFYEEAYAPLFHRNDSLFIFDYAKDRLLIFSALGRILDTVNIYHHYNPRKSGWKKNLVQDKVTGAIYAIFEVNGFSYLGLINVRSGKIENRVKLTFKYVDKIRVNNNFAYYIYRPFESLQRKYLYREQLPYKFQENEVFNQN